MSATAFDNVGKDPSVQPEVRPRPGPEAPAKPIMGRRTGGRPANFCTKTGGAYACPIKGCQHNPTTEQYARLGFINKSHLAAHMITAHGCTYGEVFDKDFEQLPVDQRVPPDVSSLQVPLDELCSAAEPGAWGNLAVCAQCFQHSVTLPTRPLVLKMITHVEQLNRHKVQKSALDNQSRCTSHLQQMTLAQVRQQIVTSEDCVARLPLKLEVWGNPLVRKHGQPASKRPRRDDNDDLNEGEEEEPTEAMAGGDLGATPEGGVYDNEGGVYDNEDQDDLEGRDNRRFVDGPEGSFGGSDPNSPDSEGANEGRAVTCSSPSSLAELVASFDSPQKWDEQQVPLGLRRTLATLLGLTSSYTAAPNNFVADIIIEHYKAACLELSREPNQDLHVQEAGERLAALERADALDRAAQELERTKREAVEPLLRVLQDAVSALDGLNAQLGAAAEVRTRSADQLRQKASFRAHDRVAQRHRVTTAFVGYTGLARAKLPTGSTADIEASYLAALDRLRSLPPLVSDPGPAVAVADCSDLADECVKDACAGRLNLIIATAQKAGMGMDVTPQPSGQPSAPKPACPTSTSASCVSGQDLGATPATVARREAGRGMRRPPAASLRPPGAPLRWEAHVAGAGGVTQRDGDAVVNAGGFGTPRKLF